MSKLRVLDLFAGIGGFSKGLHDAGGFDTVAFCEIEKFQQSILKHHWPEVPIYEDVSTTNFCQVGPVDLVTAGFPCQDISLAGEGSGLAGERSGLFWYVLRAIRMVGRPRVVLENVAELLNRGMGTVLGAMAQAGYDTQWNCFPAAAIGAPHSRDRVFIVAHPREKRREGHLIEWDTFSESACQEVTKFGDYSARCGPEWSASFPDVSMGDGISMRLVRDTVGACGNAIVPKVAEMIGKEISKGERR